MREILRELARFARRNTLSAAGGLVGMVIIFVALAAPQLARRLTRAGENVTGSEAP